MAATRSIKRLEFERNLRQAGLEWIAGVDEAGRGPLAGPVVAAAVMFPVAWIAGGLPKQLRGLNDSKQLNEEERDTYYAFLLASIEVLHAVAWVEAPMVDQINILQATHRAMNEALAKLPMPPQHVLVDGLRVNSLTFPQTPIVKGDSRSFSIAAASVIAKVTRDRFMREYHEQYPHYGFAQHKGYGTPDHLAALAQHGPCPIHRRSFAPLRPTQPELFD